MPKDSAENITANYRAVNPTKRRRLPGACDVCKKKKIKCDSGERMGRPCTNCEAAGYDCTHEATTKSFGSKGYVESLEMRMEKMEKILTRVFPGVDLNTNLERLVSGFAPDSAGSPPLASSVSPEPETAVIPRNDEGDEAVKDPDHIVFKMKNLELDPRESRFFGKSTGFQLIQAAVDLKREYIGSNDDRGKLQKSFKRQEFWEAPWWEKGKTVGVPEPDPSMFEYPEEDLLWSLVDLYFHEVHIFFPLLHRPTFERELAEGLHLRDLMFGNTVLLVCALGSKFSDDFRVLVEGSGTARSAGHKWSTQVDFSKRSFDKKPSLHELQMYALLVFFAKSNSHSHGIWIHTTLATKMGMEVGAHRRKRNQDGRQTLEDELWKRAFWTLFSLDTFMSAVSGRPCTLHEEDYDQEYPADCDDEDWEHPDPLERLQQPLHRPSVMSYFICYLRLMEIMGKVLHFLYSVRRPGDLMERAGFKLDQQAIAELDSAMNEWLDCVPDHLRWNPDCKDPVFLKQSASLHASYYHAQICIHRPFIPLPSNPSAITFPSSTICSNAARSCCYIFDVLTRSAIIPFPHLQAISIRCALILLVNVLNGKHFGLAQNLRKDMEQVHKLIDMLGACEQRWGSAGRFRDILTDLASFNNFSISSKQGGNAINRGGNTGPVLTTTDMGVGVNIESPSPMYVGGSGQLPTYAPFGVPQIPITTGGELLGIDGIHMPKDQLVGHNVFQPSGIPEGNTFQNQMSLPIAGDGGGYRPQAVMPEAMWPDQGAGQSGYGMGLEWQDQERVMQILQMMDGGGMGKWPSGHGGWKPYPVGVSGGQA